MVNHPTHPAASAAATPAIRHERLLVCCLAALAFLLALAGPVRSAEASDPWGTLLTAQALVRHGTLSLEAYPEQIREMGYRVVTVGGRPQYYFPLGTPLLAAPFVWAANLAGLDMARPADDHALQNLLSAASVAAALLLSHRLCRYWLGPWPSALIAASLTFGSVVISTMAGALWSVNSSLLVSLVCLIVLFRPGAADTLARGAAVGALAAGAYICRPTALSFVMPLFGYLLIARRRSFAGALAGATLVGTLFSALSLWAYDLPLPYYYRGGRLDQLDRPLMIAIAAFGHMLSPGRGLLVWTPQLLLVLAGIAVCFGRLRREPALWLALGWIGLHLLLTSAFSHWWGGMSYGNRLFTDAMPAFLLLAILAWRAAGERLAGRARRAAVWAFALLSAAGVAINSGQGLFNPATQDWNFVAEAQVDQYPMIVFDWRYPQFMATEQGLLRRERDYLQAPPQPNTLWGRTVWTVRKLHGSPLWEPEGVVAGSNLAVLLDRTWYAYDGPFRVRWMRGSGRLWAVAERPTAAVLRLLPALMNVGGRPGETGELAVSVNGAPAGTLELRSAEWAELTVELAAGSNEIRLDLAAGEALLTAEDPRLLGAAFRRIELLPRP